MNEEKLRQRYNRQKSIDRLPPNCLQIIYDSNFFLVLNFQFIFPSLLVELIFTCFTQHFLQIFKKLSKLF